MRGGRAEGGSQPLCPPDPTMMGILSSCEMRKLLAKASLELDPEKKDKLKNTLGHPVYGTRSKLFSAVNLVFLSNTDTEHLDSPVTFAFSHTVSPWWGRGGGGGGISATLTP